MVKLAYISKAWQMASHLAKIFSGGSGISQTGVAAPTPQGGTYNLLFGHFISRKLHEDERN